MVNLEEEEEEGDGFQGIGDDKHDTWQMAWPIFFSLIGGILTDRAIKPDYLITGY